MEINTDMSVMKHTDIAIVGSGAAGLFCALKLPADKKVTVITKDAADRSDSFLAQGGICVLRDESDYDSYFEDTMRVGHYENRRETVDIMIRSSAHVIDELVGYGVEFERDGDSMRYTREGGHSNPRILFHEDITGKEITSKLLAHVMERDNIELVEHCTMVDILDEDGVCHGLVARSPEGALQILTADYTVFACGGLGGLYEHTTNFRHITGDALAVALKHGIRLENTDYIQIHPTTLYSTGPGRRFLISESVRGEGAVLLGKDGKRFVDELLPRDLLTKEVRKQMHRDGMPYVWLSMAPIPREAIINHFPNIYRRCLEEGYDCTKECIPVVPAQHYFMGGIWVDRDSRTSMGHLYAVGETSCNGVHGRNRLASNSLLESLVFAERSAVHIREGYQALPELRKKPELAEYADAAAVESRYRQTVLDEIERAGRKRHTDGPGPGRNRKDA